MKATLGRNRLNVHFFPPRCLKRRANSRKGIDTTSFAFYRSLSHVYHRPLLESTKNWVDRVVIAERLCPFAPPLINSNSIRIVASTAQNEKQAIVDLKVELNLLMSTNHEAEANTTICEQQNMEQRSPLQRHETTLIVFDSPFVHDFREFVRLSWALQSEAVIAAGYINDVQLVLFHPKATHQTYETDHDDGTAANFTIRSPYPTIHLLREEDVLRAISGGYPNPETISSRNKERFHSQGVSACVDRLKNCYWSPIVERK
jgi:uncharacterized protein